MSYLQIYFPAMPVPTMLVPNIFGVRKNIACAFVDKVTHEIYTICCTKRNVSEFKGISNVIKHCLYDT